MLLGGVGNDHPIAARLFGRLHGLIGIQDQMFTLSLQRNHGAGHTDAHSDLTHAVPVAIGQLDLTDCLQNALRHLAGSVFCRVRQDDDKFFTAPAADKIQRAFGAVFQSLRNRPEGHVAPIVTTVVVEVLEVINVNEEHALCLLCKLHRTAFLARVADSLCAK